MIPIIAKIALLGALALTVEGINLASNGDAYLASLQSLVQSESIETRTSEPAPMLVPPPPAESQPASSMEQSQPIPTRDIPPPPQRPIIPMEGQKQPMPPQEGIKPMPPRNEIRPTSPQPPQSVEKRGQPMPFKPARDEQAPNGKVENNFDRQPMRQEPNMMRETKPEMRPPQEEFNGEEFNNEMPQESVDPREVQMVLRDIRQLTSQLKQFSTRLKKIAGSENDINKINEMLSQLSGFQSVLANPSADTEDARAAIQEFRDTNYWEEMNVFRAKVELPQQIKNITRSLTRLEKAIKVKAAQAFGLDLAKVEQAIAAMKQNLAVVQGAYNSGDFEGAFEAMQEFHENGFPGDIENTFFRIREIKTGLKRVKDTSIRAQIEQILQEIISAFNAGEYREANELMNANQNSLMKMINGRKPVNPAR